MNQKLKPYAPINLVIRLDALKDLQLYAIYISI